MHIDEGWREMFPEDNRSARTGRSKKYGGFNNKTPVIQETVSEENGDLESREEDIRRGKTKRKIETFVFEDQ